MFFFFLVELERSSLAFILLSELHYQFHCRWIVDLRYPISSTFMSSFLLLYAFIIPHVFVLFLRLKLGFLTGNRNLIQIRL